MNIYPLHTRLRSGSTFQSDYINLNEKQSIKALETKNVVVASRVTTVATIYYPNHSFLVGDDVVLEGVAPFNGTYTITSVTTDSFTFTVANSGALTDTPKVVRTEIHINEYVGPNMEVAKYIVTETLADLVSLLPSGEVLEVTIVSGLGYKGNELVAVADGISALFFTNKVVQMSKKTYATLIFSDMDRSGTTVTVTSASHGLKVGDWVTVDSSNNALDGTFQVVTVPDVDTFTYATLASGSISNATGTGYHENTFFKLYESGAQNKQYIVNELYSDLATNGDVSPGTSGTSGTAGSAGTTGSAGTSGTTGTSGTSGTSA